MIFFSLFMSLFNIFFLMQEEIILNYTLKSIISGKESSDIDRLEKVIAFVNNNIFFHEGGHGFLRANPMEILNPRIGGQCGEFSRITIVLLNKLKIPAHRVYLFEHDKDGNLFSNHVVIEVFIDGDWVLVDPMYKMIFYDRKTGRFFNSRVDDPGRYREFIDRFPGISLNRCNAPNSFIYSYPIDYINLRNNSLIYWKRVPAGSFLKKTFSILFPKRKNDISLPVFMERPYFFKTCFYLFLFLFSSGIFLEMVSKSKKVF